MKAKYLLFLTYFLLISCSETATEPKDTQSDEFLISYTKENTLTKTEIKNLAVSLLGTNGALASVFINSGVDQYRVVYNTTDFFGNQVTASGAFMIPTDINDNLALASFQHSTITNNEDAPSFLNTTSEVGIGTFFASTGYLIAMPDYLGYGESNNIDHPYESKKGLSLSSIDFIRAIKEIINAEGINWNKNLLLAGYSEGGYATLAIQKEIEENFSNEFNLKASSCGAGAYNKTATLNALLSSESSGDPNHNGAYIWVLTTYNNLYNINKPLSYYFQEPYATEIQNNGITTQISGDFKAIMQPTVLENLLNGKEIDMLEAIADNDIYDWAPNTPTQLYHGNSDLFVPFLNSETAAEAMLKNGANNLELITIEGGNHYSSVSEYLFGTFQFFQKHKND